jgi:hypothetical protein
MVICKNCGKEVKYLVGHCYCRNCYNKLRKEGKLLLNAKECTICHEIKDIYAKDMCRECYDWLRSINNSKNLTEEEKEEIKKEGIKGYKKEIQEHFPKKSQKEIMSSLQIEKISKEKAEISKKKITKLNKEIYESIKKGEIPKKLRKEIMKVRQPIIKNEIKYNNIFKSLEQNSHTSDKKIDSFFKEEYLRMKRYGWIGSTIKREDLLPKRCCFCNKKFYPATISGVLTSYYHLKSLTEINFCQSCLSSAFLGIYKGSKNKNEMLSELKMFVDVLGYIPEQKYFMNTHFIKELPLEKRDKIIMALIMISPYSSKDRGRPFPKHYPKKLKITYKDKFGSWFKSLLLAGVLKGYVRKTTRGTFCLAEDGHLCLSMKEKAIDDWLFKNSINHEKEPKYPKDEELNPKQNMRGDWKVGNYYIEYFGLAGSSDYDKKSEIKRKICSRYKINLIEIHEKDISNLDKKLGFLLNKK